MIPYFTKSGELPRGIYYATWKEFVLRFAFNNDREKQINKLMNGLKVLFEFGCEEIFIGGSFITSKLKPKDIDVAYNITFLNFKELDKKHPEFFDPNKGKYLQNKKYGCDFIGYNNYETDIVNFLRYNRNNQPIGILKFYLNEILL